MALSVDAPVLRFHRLSFVPDGDEVVVGRRDIDSYGVFPPDGAALVRELDAGRSVPDAERWYEATYGEKVDIDGLVAVLADLEFLRGEDEPVAGDAPPVGWQRLGRAVFSPLASAIYLTVVVAADRDRLHRAVARPASGERLLRDVVRGGGAHHRVRPAPAVGDP